MNKTIKFLAIFAAIFIAQLCLASALTISSATSNPHEVQPGQQISLGLTIKNSNLDYGVSDVTVTLNLNGIVQSIEGASQALYSAVPFSPYQSSNEKTIDSIDLDDHESVSFNLVANSNAISGTYTIPVTASYTLDNGTNETLEKDIFIGVVSVIVNAKPNIVVSSVGNALIQGQSGKITIQVVNSGLGTSNFLSVSLGNVKGVSMTSSDSIYIGNINSNDFDTADFNVFVSPNAPSTISLPVEIAYTDSQNNPITQDSTLLIKTYTSQEASGLGLISGSSSALIIILIVIAVIGFFVYRSIRKRIRNKKNNSH